MTEFEKIFERIALKCMESQLHFEYLEVKDLEREISKYPDSGGNDNIDFIDSRLKELELLIDAIIQSR